MRGINIRKTQTVSKFYSEKCSSTSPVHFISHNREKTKNKKKIVQLISPAYDSSRTHKNQNYYPCPPTTQHCPYLSTATLRTSSQSKTKQSERNTPLRNATPPYATQPYPYAMQPYPYATQPYPYPTLPTPTRPHLKKL